MGEILETPCCQGQYDEQKEGFFFCFGNMQDISKMDIATRGFDNCMTNMINLHTFTIRIVNLILAMVLLAHRHLLELVGDVVGSPGVDVPVCVNSV